MRQSNAYVIGFAGVVCVVCSLLLSVVSGALQEKQELNRVLDKQKNILMAAGFTPDELSALSDEDVQSTYNKRIEGLVITASGDIVKGKKPADLDAKAQAGDLKNPTELAIFRQKNDAGKTEAYIYPLTGKGLWSTLCSYLAVKPGGDEVVGIAFYQHGETPGLGAEITQSWFTNNFKGKTLHEKGKFVGIDVVKGKVADKTGINVAHAVDGISGATITGSGVGKMMKSKPKQYEAFFQKGGKR